uniref:ANK_REP_REGION domain-containing protein n=1 Tax=Gopherus agassizii TaxID=38772 RepID=A0A452HUK1_9SAUR
QATALDSPHLHHPDPAKQRIPPPAPRRRSTSAPTGSPASSLGSHTEWAPPPAYITADSESPRSALRLCESRHAHAQTAALTLCVVSWWLSFLRMLCVPHTQPLPQIERTHARVGSQGHGEERPVTGTRNAAAGQGSAMAGRRGAGGAAPMAEAPGCGPAAEPARELFEACRNGDVERVKRLVRPESVNGRDTAGRKSSPLHFAAGTAVLMCCCLETMDLGILVEINFDVS